MKKCGFLLFALLLLFSSCAHKTVPTANSCAALVQEKEDFFLRCAEEMEAFGEERLYVAMEARKAEEGEELSREDRIPRLVSYPKESDDRTEIENELLEKALTDHGLALIFFQTASDSRRCVIFSYTKESNTGVQNGFYYSPDGNPCAWWGRKAELIPKDGRFLQIDRSGKAAYFTTAITAHFYYFEKYGDLVA